MYEIVNNENVMAIEILNVQIYKKQALRSVLLQYLTAEANDKCTFLANITQTYHNICKKFSRELFFPFFSIKIFWNHIAFVHGENIISHEIQNLFVLKIFSAIWSVTLIISVFDHVMSFFSSLDFLFIFLIWNESLHNTHIHYHNPFDWKL